MNLLSVFNDILNTLKTNAKRYADECAVHPSNITQIRRGKMITVRTLKKLISHPKLTEESRILMVIAWMEDRRSEIGMSSEHFHMIPASSESLMRITGDPALVKALRDIGFKAMKDKNYHSMVMSLRDAIAD